MMMHGLANFKRPCGLLTINQDLIPGVIVQQVFTHSYPVEVGGVLFAVVEWFWFEGDNFHVVLTFYQCLDLYFQSFFAFMALRLVQNVFLIFMQCTLRSLHPLDRFFDVLTSYISFRGGPNTERCDDMCGIGTYQSQHSCQG
jgi:hypothetical protein